MAKRRISKLLCESKNRGALFVVSQLARYIFEISGGSREISLADLLTREDERPGQLIVEFLSELRDRLQQFILFIRDVGRRGVVFSPTHRARRAIRVAAVPPDIAAISARTTLPISHPGIVACPFQVFPWRFFFHFFPSFEEMRRFAARIAFYFFHFYHLDIHPVFFQIEAAIIADPTLCLDDDLNRLTGAIDHDLHFTAINRHVAALKVIVRIAPPSIVLL